MCVGMNRFCSGFSGLVRIIRPTCVGMNRRRDMQEQRNEGSAPHAWG